MHPEVAEWYSLQQLVYLGTVDGLQPRVRPVSLIHLYDRFFVITGARGGVNAAKLQQIRRNPRVEYYMPVKHERGEGFIRGSGEASIIEEPELKKQVFNMVDWAPAYFSSPDNPDYVLLEITHDEFSYRAPGEHEIHPVSLASSS